GLAEPARGFRGDDAAVDAANAIAAVDLVLNLRAAPVVQPREKFGRARPERHGGENRRARNLSRVEAWRRPGGLDRALAHRVEDLKRRDEGVRLVELDLERAA